MFYCISGYVSRIYTERSITFHWNLCLHFGRTERFQIIFFWKIQSCFYFNEYLLKFFSKKYPLKLNLLLVELSINIHWKFWIGSKIKEEKVNEISLKNNFTDHSLKVQWLFSEIFSLIFTWYMTFTPVHKLYITWVSTQFSNSAVPDFLSNRSSMNWALKLWLCPLLN